MHLQITTSADAEIAYAALTTQEGINGWWTSRAEVPGGEGRLIRASFPGAPVTWDLRIRELAPSSLVAWRIEGAPPPQLIGTEIVWALEPSAEGTVVRLDHRDFAEVDDIFRIVTVRWAQLLDKLRAYTDSRKPAPFFDF